MDKCTNFVYLKRLCLAFHISTEIQFLKHLLINKFIYKLRILNSGITMFRLNSESSAANNRGYPIPHYIQVDPHFSQFVSNVLI